MGHWYSKTGDPVFKVAKASGKGMRDTTIRDARKLNLYPSVTTILQILSKWGLADWQTGIHLDMVYDNQYLLSNTKEEFLNKVKAKARVEMNKPSEAGTELHAILEKHFKNQSQQLDGQGIDLIKAVEEWLIKKELTVVHSERRLIPDVCGYGGTVDLICEDKYKSLVFVDFKSTDFSKKKKLKPYDDHFMQLCAYLLGYSNKHGRLINLYLDRTIVGDIQEYEYSKEEISKYSEAWELCFKLFKCLKGI